MGKRGLALTHGKGGEALLQEPSAVPSAFSKFSGGIQGFVDALRKREKGLCEPRKGTDRTCPRPPPAGKLLLLLLQRVQLLAKVQRCTSSRGKGEREGERRRVPQKGGAPVLRAAAGQQQSCCQPGKGCKEPLSLSHQRFLLCPNFQRVKMAFSTSKPRPESCSLCFVPHKTRPNEPKMLQQKRVAMSMGAGEFCPREGDLVFNERKGQIG